MLNEAGENVRVEDGVDLSREDWVKSIGARLDRLDRLCSWWNFNFNGALGTFSVVTFGREDIYEVGEGRRKGVNGRGIPKRGVQREVYVSDVRGGGVPRVKG